MNSSSQETEYQDLLKTEFKDMLSKFLEPRDYFHVYAIGRTCTHGTMLGFEYRYYTISDKTDVVGKYMILNGYGEIHFEINCNSNYGRIISDNSTEIIENFINNYNTNSTLMRAAGTPR